MNRKCIHLKNKIQETTLQRWRCITDETAAERMQVRMLGCQPRVHYPSAFNFFPLIISHISTFCHTQPFPPLSSHLRKKMWFPFSPDFDFLPWGSLLAIPLNAMQWGQSLLSFFPFYDKNFCDKLCPVLDWHQFLWEREKKRRSRHVSKDRRD